MMGYKKRDEFGDISNPFMGSDSEEKFFNQ